MTSENESTNNVVPPANNNSSSSNNNASLPIASSPFRQPAPPPMPLSPPPGSPVMNRHNARLRSLSLGHHPIFPSGAPSPPPHRFQPGSSRSVPVSPVTGRPLSMGNNHGEPPLPFFPAAVALPHPPEPSERQKVMEAAVAAERLRAKALEPKEAEMTADELRVVLKQERRRTAKIAADLAALKKTAVELQSEAEVVEEGRINALMKRLDGLQQEKGRIINELEREEEMLTNTLQKQLNEVRREKALLQQQIEKETRSNSTMSNHLSSLKESNNGAMGGVLEEGEEEEEGAEEENDDNDNPKEEDNHSNKPVAIEDGN